MDRETALACSPFDLHHGRLTWKFAWNSTHDVNDHENVVEHIVFATFDDAADKQTRNFDASSSWTPHNFVSLEFRHTKLWILTILLNQIIQLPQGLHSKSTFMQMRLFSFYFSASRELGVNPGEYSNWSAINLSNKTFIVYFQTPSNPWVYVISHGLKKKHRE